MAIVLSPKQKPFADAKCPDLLSVRPHRFLY